MKALHILAESIAAVLRAPLWLVNAILDPRPVRVAQGGFLGAIIGGIGSIVGGVIGAGAAERAAEAQAQTTNRAIDLQEKIWRAQRKDIAPFREEGTEAVRALGREIDPLTARFTEEEFRADPGYQYRLEEGEGALNRAAAARGMYYSPATLRRLQAHGQGLADQTYQDAFNRYQLEQGNRFNRLAALAGVGQTGVQQQIGAGGQYASNVGNLLTNLGASQAAGITGAANMNISGLTGATSAISEHLAMNRLLNTIGGQTGVTVPSYDPMALRTTGVSRY